MLKHFCKPAALYICPEYFVNISFSFVNARITEYCINNDPLPLHKMQKAKICTDNKIVIYWFVTCVKSKSCWFILQGQCPQSAVYGEKYENSAHK